VVSEEESLKARAALELECASLRQSFEERRAACQTLQAELDSRPSKEEVVGGGKA
jgi:hypothetical protein